MPRSGNGTAPGPTNVGRITSLQKNTIDNEDFVQGMTNFVKKPTLESALHYIAVAQMGLMPALPLPDELLKMIATYYSGRAVPTTLHSLGYCSETSD